MPADNEEYFDPTINQMKRNIQTLEKKLSHNLIKEEQDKRKVYCVEVKAQISAMDKTPEDNIAFRAKNAEEAMEIASNLDERQIKKNLVEKSEPYAFYLKTGKPRLCKPENINPFGIDESSFKSDFVKKKKGEHKDYFWFIHPWHIPKPEE